jgi:hypothetical protein
LIYDNPQYIYSEKALKFTKLSVFFSSIFVLGFLLFALSTKFFDFTVLVRGMQVFGILCLFFSLRIVNKNFFCLIVFFLLLVSFFLVNNAFYGQFTPVAMFPLLCFGVSICALYTVVCRVYFVVGFVNFILFLFLVYCFYDILFRLNHPNFVLVSSRNHIAIVAFSLWSLVYVLNDFCEKGMLFKVIFGMSSILSLVLLAVFTGRVGLFMAIVIFMLMYFKNGFRVNGFSGFFIKYLPLVVFSSLFFIYLIGQSEAFAKFENRGLSDVRWDIVKWMILNSEAYNYFFGFEFGITQRVFGYTPHNSFLEAYIFYGFIGLSGLLLFFAVYIFRAFYISPRIFLLAITTLVSSFFDTGTFFGPFVGLVVFLIFFHSLMFKFNLRYLNWSFR